MTKSNLYVKIKQFEYSVEKGGSIKFKMEVNAERVDETVPLHSEFNRTCAQKDRMDKLYVNLKEAANYLIQLFYRTDTRFSCTRTKVGKLLSIVAFSYAREDKLFLKEKIRKYDDCGTIINELESHVDREVYLRCEYDNSQQQYTAAIDESVALVDLVPKYEKISSLSECVKTRIREIFCIFCAYSPSDLGQCICPIVNHADVTDENGEVDLQRLFAMTHDDFKTEDYPSTLVDYLFQ